MAFDANLAASLAGHKLELSLTDRSGRVANFVAAYDDLVAEITDAGDQMALDTLALAYEYCAVASGFMRDHLTVITSPKGQTWEIGWQASDFFEAGFAFYPMYVVLGTRHMPPRDPLTPAYQASRGAWEDRIAEAMRRGLERRRMSTK